MKYVHDILPYWITGTHNILYAVTNKSLQHSEFQSYTILRKKFSNEPEEITQHESCQYKQLEAVLGKSCPLSENSRVKIGKTGLPIIGVQLQPQAHVTGGTTPFHRGLQVLLPVPISAGGTNGRTMLVKYARFRLVHHSNIALYNP